MKALFWATSPGPKRLPHVDVDGQYNSSLMYKSAGRSAFVPPIQVDAAHTALCSSQTVCIRGHINMGADILSRQGLKPGEWKLHPEVNLAGIRQNGSVPVGL